MNDVWHSLFKVTEVVGAEHPLRIQELKLDAAS